MNIILKKFAAYPLLSWNRTVNAFLKKYDKEFVILMYHRIIRKFETETHLEDAMYVEPETFERQMEYIRKNFNVIPLNKIFQLNETSRNGYGKPYCMVTFDDGWKDFYENAYPVLKIKEIPATVFLPTDFVGTSKRFWTEDLARIVSGMDKNRSKGRKSNDLPNPVIGKIQNMVGTCAEKTEKAIATLKIFSIEDIYQILESMAEIWEVDLHTSGRSFLSWDEVREMYRSGLINYGSHTRSHQILTTVPETTVREELYLSKDKLMEEGIVDPSFIPFVYPNGDYNRRISEIVEEEGYSLALTTEKGWNDTLKDRKEFYRLKRIGIHQDISSTNAMLACRIYCIY